MNDDTADTSSATPSPDDAIEDRLESADSEAGEVLRTFSAFRKRALQMRSCDTVSDALDIAEALIEEVVEFLFMRVFVPGADGELECVRAFCPEEYETPWEFLSWALDQGEIALIPREAGVAGENAPENVRSLLLLPLVGHRQDTGAIVLWVEFDADHFTEERRMLLDMLAGEAASVLESLRMRQEIEDARAVLSDVVENIPLGIMAVDASDRLTLVNGTAEFMFGLRRTDTIGETLQSFLSPKAAAEINRLCTEEGFAEEGEIELQGQFEGGEGETYGISCAPIRVGEDLQIAGYVIVCRDLKMSREIAKLRELDAMKNDFISLVSHELRTPLTSIMAYSETLLMEGMIDSEEERKEYLEIIYSEGERLSRLINDVLDLTKMESGKMDYIYAEANVNDVVRTSMMSAHAIAAQKDIELLDDFDENLPKVNIDSDKITQVVMNLFSNAVKFTPENGTITAHTAVVEDEGRECVRVSVTDTGCGIAPEDIHKVFSKFEMIENIDHHSVGTGLGMPICQQIIEHGHDGRIWIESDVGKGTTVSFTIPVV